MAEGGARELDHRRMGVGARDCILDVEDVLAE
jgi:hypothetical protein